MKVIVRKSTALAEAEFRQISALFEEVFGKPRSPELLHRQYEQNPFGYAWLSMLVDDGRIVGLNSYVPSYYTCNGKKLIFANSIDSMVEKPYRDFFNFNDMIRGAYKAMADEGVSFVYGYPNDNAFPVLTKGKLMKPIGKMYTYCLPYRVGGIKPSLKALNVISKLFSQVYSICSGWFASSKVCGFMVEKDAASYNDTRYKRGDANYCHADLGDGQLHYKIVDHEGVRTAFIIDIDRKSPSNFNKGVRYLLKNHSKEFDLILYPGWLPFGNTGMIRMPRKLEPKNFNFTGKMLAKKGELPEGIWSIENWDTNLSNYDLI